MEKESVLRVKKCSVNKVAMPCLLSQNKLQISVIVVRKLGMEPCYFSPGNVNSDSVGESTE